MSSLKMGDVINIDPYTRKAVNPNRTYKYNRSDESFETWKQMTVRAMKDITGWRDHDALFLETSVTYNGWHLMDNVTRRSLGTFPIIEALTLKTVACLETSPAARNNLWRSNPMQIGNSGDAGINDVLGHDSFHKQMSELIIPPLYRYITLDTLRKNPRENIIAATAYILMRHCTFASATFIQDNNIKEFTTTKDTYRFGDIARVNGSTEDVVKLLNPDKNPKAIRVGDKIKYQQAERKMVIKQFDQPTWDSIADLYNVAGENLYGKKLAYINSLLRQGY